MKRLTDNDIDLLRLMWQSQRVERPSLASWEKRTADRLLDAGILTSGWAQHDLSGLGYNHNCGSGWHVVLEYDPERAVVKGDPATIAQIRERAPGLLEPRPVGEAARACFRIVD